MQQQADEEELGLSPAALAALQEFAAENNLGLEEGATDVRLQVQERMDVKSRHHEFNFVFGEGSNDEQVFISLRGMNPELGQTLASTGLTVWRAAQEMARFMWEHRKMFTGKSVLELGAGLGLCGVLASHLCKGGEVVVTDGGNEFTNSAMDVLRDNLKKNGCNLTTDSAIATGQQDGARTSLEKLTWGDHTSFLKNHTEGFDFIVAADVIYEDEAVTPLLRTVADLLQLRRYAPMHENRYCHSRPPVYPQHTIPGDTTSEAGADVAGAGAVIPLGAKDGLWATPGVAEPEALESSMFLLAFARRNVPIDKVLREAESLGLRWRIPEDFQPASVSENIYLMCLER